MIKQLRYLAILFLSFCAIESYGQNGFLRGNIVDGENGEGLIGTTVVKEGTVQGTIADFEGNYSLSLGPGIHTIVFQFVSYQKKTVSNVEIKSGEITFMDVLMTSALTELDEVVVTAEQIRDSEVALLSVQKKSANLVDGISAQSFKKTGDGNLASAMKRVTGVSVQGGKYIYVRGLGDRYTKTTLNQMTIPGLDPDNNSVQIDIFPTGTIENVIVYKTFSPDLLGDFTGGMVDVETKSFPEEKSTGISVALAFTPGMHLTNDYISYDGSRTDFLGFDSGSRGLPFNKNTKIADVSSGDSQVESITRSFNKSLAAQKRNSFMNTSLSFNHGNQINKNKVTFGYNAVFNYQNKYTYYDDLNFGEYFKEPNKSENGLRKEETRRGELGQHEVLWSALLSGALKFKNHSISTNLLRSQNGQSQASNRVNRNFEQTSATLVEDILTYTERSITNNIIIGKHHFDKFDIQWRNALTFSKIYDPDFRTTSVSVTQGDTTLLLGDGAGINRFYRDLNEFNESFKIDVTVPLAEKTKVKFGGVGIFKKRDFEVLNYNLRVTNPLAIEADPDWFLRDENVWTPETGQGTFVVGNFEPANSYDARQTIFGFYGMADMQILPRLRAIYGLRVEQVKMYYTGQNNQGDVVYDDELTLDELDLLPSTNLVFSVKDDMNIRGSFNRTLARPTFTEKSIAQIFDPISGRTRLGNIDLEETHINNFDLRWENFFTPTEMFSVSFFYKRFDGHIELTSIKTAPDNLKPRNAGSSSVFGAEIEFRKNLEFISPRLQNVSFGTNVSVVDSKIDLNAVIVDETGTTELELREANLRDGESLSDTRDMAGQAPYLINAFLNYSTSEGKTNVNLAYNVQGETLSIVGSGSVPDVFTKPFASLNLNAYRDFGKSEKSRVTVGINNILNDTRENVYKSFGADEEIFSLFRPNRTFSVKYSLRF